MRKRMLRLQRTIEDSNQPLNILSLSPASVDGYNDGREAYKEGPNAIEIIGKRDSNHLQHGPVEKQNTCAEKEWQ
jgi:hypothetical protein